MLNWKRHVLIFQLANEHSTDSGKNFDELDNNANSDSRPEL